MTLLVALAMCMMAEWTLVWKSICALSTKWMYRLSYLDRTLDMLPRVVEQPGRRKRKRRGCPRSGGRRVINCSEAQYYVEEDYYPTWRGFHTTWTFSNWRKRWFYSTLFYPIQHCVKFVVLQLILGETTRHTWLGRNPDLDPKWQPTGSKNEFTFYHQLTWRGLNTCVLYSNLVVHLEFSNWEGLMWAVAVFTFENEIYFLRYSDHTRVPSTRRVR